jgi:hypothetical protein
MGVLKNISRASIAIFLNFYVRFFKLVDLYQQAFGAYAEISDNSG